jgi:hypothetical protein
MYLGDELLVAVDYNKFNWIIVEEILNNEDVDYTVIWQSKYNSYVSYDYAPFCQEGFMLNYYIKGKPEYLEYLQYVIQKALDETDNNKEFLNKCYSIQNVYDNLGKVC